MSSVGRAFVNTKQGNDFFINVSTITTNATDLYSYTESTNTMTAADFSGATALNAASFSAGGLLVKDLGKTVTVSGATYRKAQAFNIPSGVTDTTLAPITFYILLNPATGLACKWARMTIQA